MLLNFVATHLYATEFNGMTSSSRSLRTLVSLEPSKRPIDTCGVLMCTERWSNYKNPSETVETS
jgi:hypothetical protein